MALDALLARFEGRAVTPVTPAVTLDVTVRPAWIGACTPVTPVTAEYRLAANDPEPPQDPAAWRELAQAYHAHHFNCQTCQAAGRGAMYGLRCGVGASLWTKYTNQSTPQRKVKHENPH